jgi:transcriptional regulator with XRE-family HTH domain
LSSEGKSLFLSPKDQRLFLLKGDPPMSPWSFADILRDDIDAWVSRCKHEAHEQGKHLVGSVFRGRLAAKVGVTIKQLDRYCSGECMPPPERLKVICQEIGTVRAVKHLARECGVGVYDLVPAEQATLADQVRQTATILRETGEATQAAMAADRDGDGMISITEFRAVEKEVEEAIHALEGIIGMLRVKVEAGLRR